MIQAGVNSYVTVQEADNYIGIFYAGTAVYEEWLAMAESNKEISLTAACSDMESLPFTGRAYKLSQPLAFPRYPSSTVPEAIKTAQIEIALYSMRGESQGDELITDSERARLQKQGVISFTLGSLTEVYGDSIVQDYPFMADPKISKLLNRYLNGGYAFV